LIRIGKKAKDQLCKTEEDSEKTNTTRRGEREREEDEGKVVRGFYYSNQRLVGSEIRSKKAFLLRSGINLRGRRISKA